MWLTVIVQSATKQLSFKQLPTTLAIQLKVRLPETRVDQSLMPLPAAIRAEFEQLVKSRDNGHVSDRTRYAAVHA
jgi:hypothetical protein